jgi:nitroreductase
MLMDISTVDHLLTTTRSVRKRLDLQRPVEPEVIEQCLEIAVQAPSGSNVQGWHFMVVTDAEKRASIAQLYRESFKLYTDFQKQNPAQYAEGDPRNVQVVPVYKSAAYLARHLPDVPVHIIPCIEGHVGPTDNALTLASRYGSILPATWSLMLALRARGLGASWTTLHLRYEQEAAAILNIPENIMQVALLPVAYFKGTDFKPAKRLPARERTYWDSWGQLND